MSKIYISGPISVLPIEEAKQRFDNSAIDLYYYGNYDIEDIVNPFNINPFLGLKNWWCYMINDVRELLKCDSIYMLKGWQKSRGACVEHLIAVWRKMDIIYQV